MVKCNCCGKQADYDMCQEPMVIKYRFGYGSKRDLDTLDVTLCPDCAEKLTQGFVDGCIINPIVEPDFEKGRVKTIFDYLQGNIEI